MTRSLSSSWTFPVKYLFPSIWIPAAGAGVIVAFRGAGAQRTAIPAAWIFLVIWAAASVLLLALALRLKRVELVDGALRVSNYWKQITVPLAGIARVKQNRWINLRPVNVSLRIDTPFGRSFAFIPMWAIRASPWREDPIVAELRRLAGLHEGG